MARFQKATKRKAKLRAALFGPSGAGKTFTALRIATGMASATGMRIGVIDTERRTASKYSDLFGFDVLDLENRTVDDYCQAIHDAQSEGIGILIIDSMSHGWQELLEEVDKLAKAKYRGNTWSAWSDGTPKQRHLIDTITDYPGHVIVTMRSKTEWQTESSNGKTKPVRVGLAPEQGKGIEYEFDLLIEMSAEHYGSIIKDRTGKYQDKIIEKPGEAFGRALIDWLNDGAEEQVKAKGTAPLPQPAAATQAPAPQAAPAAPQPAAPKQDAKQPTTGGTAAMNTADKRLELMKRLQDNATAVDAFLVAKTWLKPGEGLPSLSDDKVERFYNNFEEIMKMFKAWNLMRENDRKAKEAAAAK